MNDFFVEYWSFFVYLIVALIGILISLFKKPKAIIKKIDTPFERVMALLPGFIVEAEKTGMHGINKLNYCVYAAMAVLQKLIDRELTIEEITEYQNKIAKAIESILETPQKKGIKDDEEKKN